MLAFRLAFAHSPLFLPLCAALGILYAYLLYRAPVSWSRPVRRLLFALRALLVALLAVLLIGPIVQYVVTRKEKPSLAVLIDNSLSVKEAVDTTAWTAFYARLEAVRQRLERRGIQVDFHTLDEKPVFPVALDHPSSDLGGAAQRVMAAYEGKNPIGLLVVSDGLYNTGSSPLYASSRLPVFTLGVGDTVQHPDVRIKQALGNALAQQGSRFPIHVEVIGSGVRDTELTVSLYRRGQKIAQRRKRIGEETFLEIEFQVAATGRGLQRFEVAVEPLPGERNVKNNRAEVYVEVIEQKRQLLIAAPAPHPDIKALRAALAHTRYTAAVHIPGIQRAQWEWEGKRRPAVTIVRYADDAHKVIPVLDSARRHGIPLLILLGRNADPGLWEERDLPIAFARPPRSRYRQPAVNTRYAPFRLTEAFGERINAYSPVRIDAGSIRYPVSAEILLYQRETGKDGPFEKPLLLSLPGSPPLAVLFGEGIWRWRMREFMDTDDTVDFDDLFSKLIQYLSAGDNAQRFRCFPLQKEFTVAEAVVFEHQAYDALYEPLYDYPVQLTLTDGQGKDRSYSYSVTLAQSRYTLGALDTGVYRYRASTYVQGKKREAKGVFRVKPQRAESYRLVADFDMLRAWSRRTGGAFYTSASIDQLVDEMDSKKIPNVVHSTSSFRPLIDIKWVFGLLLMLISGEWLIRKRKGGY